MRDENTRLNTRSHLKFFAIFSQFSGKLLKKNDHLEVLTRKNFYTSMQFFAGQNCVQIHKKKDYKQTP